MKTKRCKICDVEFIPSKSTQRVCSLDCAVQDARTKREERQLKETRKRQKELREEWNMETLSQKMNKLQEIFNKWIRLRDQGRKCISCNVILKKGMKYDASHFYSVGSYPELRFNPLNVHASCVHCNQHLRGNIHEYRKRLPGRIGEDALKELDDLAGTSLHLMRHEVEDLIAEYRAKVRLLEGKKK